MNNLSAYITELLVEFNFVSTDNKEICKYGIENLLISVIEITSILIIGSILEKTIPTIIFVATIVILRRYTGGYHANTKIGCYLVFVLSYIIFLVTADEYLTDGEYNMHGPIYFSDNFSLTGLTAGHKYIIRFAGSGALAGDVSTY